MNKADPDLIRQLSSLASSWRSEKQEKMDFANARESLDSALNEYRVAG